MKLLFFALLAAYMSHALWVNWRRSAELAALRPQASRGAVLLQTPVFLLSAYFAARAGVFDRSLVSPLAIAAGLALGHLIFGVSLLITDRNVRDAAAHFFDFGALWNFLVESPDLLFRFFAVSVAEELIYRAVAQPLLIEYTGHVWPSILGVALMFSVVHWHFFRNPIEQSAEFIAFAVLLGALYYWTGSLVLVIVIHTVRNIEIVYLEYLVKLEELGDPAQAIEALSAGLNLPTAKEP